MRWIFFFLGVLLVISFGLLFWLKYGRFGPLRTGQIQIDQQRIEIEIADTVLSRSRGLSGRNGLIKDHGMLFVFQSPDNNGFWMKDMKFPLDMIWIKGNQVIGVTPQVQPELGRPLWKLKIYYPPEAVDKVLEVTAGTAALYSWHTGSVVLFPDSLVK